MLTTKVERQHMNRVGLVFLSVVALQYIITFATYFTFALAMGQQIPFYSALPQDLLRTLKEVQTSLKATPYPYIVTLLLTTIISEILPCIIVMKSVGIVPNVDFLGTSKVGAGKVALFGVCGFAGSIVASILVAIISAILKIFKIKAVSPQMNIPWNEPPAAILMLITVVLIAPFAEEFLCRGVFLTVFKRFGAVFAIVGSSLLWAILHGNIIQGIPVFVMGLFFGLLAYKANSIWPTFILHSLNNMLAVTQLSMRNQGAMGLIGIAITTWGLLIAGIVLFSCLHNNFKVKKCPSDAYGFKTFFTSPSILIGIAIMLILTTKSFVAI